MAGSNLTVHQMESVALLQKHFDVTLDLAALDRGQVRLSFVDCENTFIVKVTTGGRMQFLYPDRDTCTEMCEFLSEVGITKVDICSISQVNL